MPNFIKNFGDIKKDTSYFKTVFSQTIDKFHVQ